MSGLRVTTRGGGRSLNIFQYATAKSVDRLHLEAAKLVENRVGKHLREGYRHTVQTIGFALSVGMPGSIGTPGSKRVTYQKLDGSPGRISTESWLSLSKRYTDPEAKPTWWKKKRMGTPFWKNSDELATSYWEGTGAHRVSFSVNVKKKQSAVPSRTHHKDRFRIKSVWAFQRLPDRYLDELIRPAFVQGDENASPARIAGLDTGGSPTWKAWVSEKGRTAEGTPSYKGRPWMARMAAALGRELRSQVRKV